MFKFKGCNNSPLLCNQQTHSVIVGFYLCLAPASLLGMKEDNLVSALQEFQTICKVKMIEQNN